MAKPTHALRLTTPLEGTGHRPWNPEAPIDAPLCLLKTTVAPHWVDYNGHMSESCYLLVFGDNSDAFFRFVGIDEDYRAAGHSLYTVQTHLHNLREVAQGEPIRLSLQMLDADDRRIHFLHAMFHGISGELLATAEQMLVHVDMSAGRSVAMPADLHTRVQAIRAAHAVLPKPAQAGQPIGIRRKPV